MPKYLCSSSYNDRTATFTLASVLSPAPNPAPEPLNNLHFVYQRLEADATLTAKLLTATGEVGLMVQEANETSSAYVFIGVKDNQLQVIVTH